MGSSLLKNKLEEIEVTLKQFKPCVFMLTEANLFSNVNTEEVRIEGYTLVCPKMLNNTTLQQARVVMYVKETLNFKVRLDLMSDWVSSIWIETRGPGGKSTLICATYREHQYLHQLSDESRSDRDQLDRWDVLINQWKSALSGNKHCVLMGDVNLDYTRWDSSDYLHQKMIDSVKDNIVTLGATQSVDKVTRSSRTGRDSLLDHAWTNCPEYVSKVLVTDKSTSDHRLVILELSGTSQVSGDKYTRKRDMSRFEGTLFRQELDKLDWSDLYSTNSVSVAVSILTENISKVLDTNSPVKKRQIRTNHAPWVSADSLKLMTFRDEKRKLSDNNKTDTSLFDDYKLTRNLCNRALKSDRKSWERNKIKILETESDAKKLWAFVNKKIKISDSGPPSVLIKDGVIKRKAREIADAQNDFYLSKIKNLRNELSTRTNFAANPLSVLDTCLSKWTRSPQEQFTVRQVTLSNTLEMIQAVKMSTTEGLDHISSMVIKEGGMSIARPLNHVINLSIQTNTFPTHWKLSKTIPLYKCKGLRTASENYRPVAILASASKVLEITVARQMNEYMRRTGQWHGDHHAFLHNKSTTSGLLQLADYMSEMVDSGKISVALLIDMSAAFDMVDRTVLDLKLEKYGFDNNSRKWMESYLSDRSQCVEINGVLSSFKPILCGVPQGSVLGPLIYVLYTNELPAVASHHCGFCQADRQSGHQELFPPGCEACGQSVIYADDTSHILGESTTADILDHINELVDNLEMFLTSNRLIINKDKTHWMLGMTRQRRTKDLTPRMMLTVENDEIPQSRTEKLLGCYLHEDMNWTEHVVDNPKSMTTKIIKSLGDLMRAGSKLSTSAKLKLSNGLIMSKILYGCAVWGGVGEGSKKKLQYLQNRAARWTLQLGIRTRTSVLLDKCGWLSINQLCTYTSLMELWKILHISANTYWSQRLMNTTGQRQTRAVSDGKVRLEHPLLTITRHSWKWRTTNIWNSLPPELRCTKIMSQFKRNLRIWISSNVPIVAEAPTYSFHL